MHKFLIRAASGIIYAAVIFFAIIYGGWALWLLAIAFTAIGVCEIDNMAVGCSKKTVPYYIVDVAGALSLLSVAVCRYAILLWIALEIVKIVLANRHRRLNSGSFPYPAYSQIYLAVPMACMVASPISRLPLLVFIMLWLNDSGAYIVGSLIGRHKLCPSISPNKTWEGFIGGMAITCVGAWFLDSFCPDFFGMQTLDLGHWMILALAVCIFGTLGDLLESKIKRHYGVKDSGSWIPGHGGILDRIDSFLIAFPAALLIILLFGL